MSAAQQFQEMMASYDSHHQNRTNVMIHCFAVPAIYWSVIGLFWCLSLALGLSINLVWPLVIAVSLYYLTLSVRHGLFMSVITLLMVLSVQWIDMQQLPLLTLSIAVFVVMWLFQFWGHKIEGKKPSFLEDLRFLLIGPLWWANHFIKAKFH